MKPHQSPTSPKSKQKEDNAFSDYYKNNTSAIQKPVRQKVLKVIIVSLIFSIIGSLLTLFLLIYLSPRIPWINELNLFSQTSIPQYITRSAKENKIEISSSFINEISESLVQIKILKINSSAIENSYLSGSLLGNGLVLTNDGWVVGLKSFINVPESELVVITSKNEIYAVDQVLQDPVSDFTYIKIDAKNLKSVAIADYDEFNLSDSLLLLNKLSYNENVISWISRIIDLQHFIPDTIIDAVKNSEEYQPTLLLEKSDSLVGNAPVFTLDKKAAGFVKRINEKNYLYPFSLVDGILDNLLNEEIIERPFLGVRLLDLTQTLNLANATLARNDRGLMIYSDDEKNNPSIISKSPAEKAGLKKGDIIISLNDNTVNNFKDFQEQFFSLTADQLITIGIERDGIAQEVKVTLDKVK